MSDATELVSLADLKAYIQITGSTFDTILTALKSAVETWIKNYCRDPFLVAEYTEYYDGNGGLRLHVRHYPITTVKEINIDSDRAFLTATKIATANIISMGQNNDQGVIELFDESFSEGQKNIKVIYSAGYSAIPADLQQAVKIICARQFLTQDKKMAGIVSQNVGDKTITLNLEEIPRDAWLMLSPYRRALV